MKSCSSYNCQQDSMCNFSLEFCRFYYNKKTKVSSWEKPFELMTPIEVSHTIDFAFTLWLVRHATGCLDLLFFCFLVKGQTHAYVVWSKIWLNGFNIFNFICYMLSVCPCLVKIICSVSLLITERIFSQAGNHQSWLLRLVVRSVLWQLLVGLSDISFVCFLWMML